MRLVIALGGNALLRRADGANPSHRTDGQSGEQRHRDDRPRRCLVNAEWHGARRGLWT